MVSGIVYRHQTTFGNFQRLLSDYPAETLFEAIPHFHDTEDRLRKFREAVAADAMGRAGECQAEIDFVMSRQADCSVALQALRSGILPLRVTHNDTKLNNVLIDDETGKALCVIDLDTVMPGSALYDYGDAVRYGACTSAEDEPDTSKIDELDITNATVENREDIVDVLDMITSDEAEEEYSELIEKKDFTEAVLACAESAESGDCVLLSPACASFDAFANFEVRGERFKEIVAGL